MPLVTPTAPSALSTPPSTQDPTTFDSRADTFLGQLPAFRTSMNQLATDSYTNASYAQEQAISASVQAASATTQAANAAASATAANNVAGAGKWSAATSYAEGNTVWSPVNFQTYRKRTSGSSTTAEPSITPTVWELIGSTVPHFILQAQGIV